MTKPIKPIKPSKRDIAPQLNITESKLLVYDTFNKKYMLIDHKSHPTVFCSDITEFSPNINELEEKGLEWNLEYLSYNEYNRINRDCMIPSSDFTICPMHNCDNYYEYSMVNYNIVDVEYHNKLKIYNNRFINYESELKKYEIELNKYNEYKKEEMKIKLQKKLDSL